MSSITQLNQLDFKIKRFKCDTLTALAKGTPMVFNYDYGTAATQELSRNKRIVVASAADCKDFAGVLAQAKAVTTSATFVDVILCGGGAMVTASAAVTIGDILNASCGDTPAEFVGAAFGRGKGAAIALQTITESGVLPVQLLEGEANSIVQSITPVAAGGAITVSVEGLTTINGGTVADAHITATLADGTYVGQRKAVTINTLIGGSKNFVYTITTGKQVDGATALVSLTFNAADEQAVLEWTGAHWQLLSHSGVTIAAA